MKKGILIIIMFFCVFQMFGQRTISGFISDSISGEKLIGATVYDLFSGAGCVSNNYGFYSLTIKDNDSAMIVVSYTGYNKEFFKTDTLKNNIKNISLQPGVFLNTFEVSASKQISNINGGNISVPLELIKKLPALGGETDLMKTLQMLPGINSGSEGTSNLYVRGGSQDQNLIIIDDVPLYYVNHLAGFVSVFNTDALNSVNICKSEFSAQYGGRLSSVIDVRMKDGNNDKINVSGMVGIISTKIYVDGPVIKDKATFMVSARRMMLDLLTRPFTALAFGPSTGYSFYDVNTKFQYRFSGKNTLHCSFYNGDDDFSVTDKNEDNGFQKTHIQWGNNVFSTRWNHVWSQKLFSNVTLSATHFRFGMSGEYRDSTDNAIESSLTEFYSGIKDYMAGVSMEYFKSNKNHLLFGGNLIFHQFNPGATHYSVVSDNAPSIDSLFGSQKSSAFDLNIYTEDKITIGKLILKPGIRFNTYMINSTTFNSIDPRFSISGKIRNIILFTSCAKLSQNVHLLTTSGTGIPYDLWLPATSTARPSNATHITTGFNTSLFKQKYPFSFQLYYKSMDNLIMYKEGASIAHSALDWEQVIETGGRGKAYGAEWMIEKNTGKLNGWISYTLSKTDRQFDNINNGKAFPFVYDNRHIINISAVYYLCEQITLSASWNFKSGNAITLASGKYYYDTDTTMMYPDQIHYYSGVNNFRMRSYHRLDIGASFIKKKKWGTRTWTVSIYNLYNRQNPYYYYFKGITESSWTSSGYIQSSRLALFQKSLFPFIPSVSYSFVFGK